MSEVDCKNQQNSVGDETIKRITVVTNQGTEEFFCGCELDSGIVHEINISPVRFTGDPFDHYCGYSADGKLLFTIERSTPCVVEYY